MHRAMVEFDGSNQGELTWLARCSASPGKQEEIRNSGTGAQVRLHFAVSSIHYGLDGFHFIGFHLAKSISSREN